MLDTLRSTRHLHRAVLAAFACVLLTSALAPALASTAAPTMEVCSAGPGGVHGGAPADEGPDQHGLSCAMCLPIGLAAPLGPSASATEFLAGVLPASCSTALPARRAAWRPPARAPPNLQPTR